MINQYSVATSNPAPNQITLDEMFTFARLGITGALVRSLTNTNCIESMISTVRG